MAEPTAFHRTGRLWGGLFAFCLLVSGLAGCSPVAEAPTLTRQETLTQALARGDASAFAAQFAPGTTVVVGRLYDNLVQVRPVVFSGTDADTIVDWTLGGRSASIRLRLLTDPAGRISSILASEQTPLWLGNGVTVFERGRVTILAATSAERWLDVADRAADDLVRTPLGPLAAGWDGRLVVELPATQQGLAALVHEPDLATAQVGGVTFAEGDASGPLRIALGPTLLRATDAEKRATLVHEGVHLATAAPRRTAPVWVTEGLAESIAVSTDPLLAGQRRRRLLEALATGLPTSLPDDAAFAGDAERVRLAYDLAGVAVEALIEHEGREAALRDLAAWSGSGTTARKPADVLPWYRARLAALLGLRRP